MNEDIVKCIMLGTIVLALLLFGGLLQSSIWCCMTRTATGQSVSAKAENTVDEVSCYHI